MIVWCSISQADMFKKPQWEEIAKWHGAKMGRFFKGAWPKKLPDYVSLDVAVAVPPSPYHIMVPGEDLSDDTDFMTEAEEDEDE